MMTCRELADFIADYLSGELADQTRARFEHHLALCVNCRNYLERYRLTVELGRRAFDVDGGDVPEELVKAILASRKR